LNNSEYHAGDYDASIPGVYGEPNLTSEESSREIIPLLQKLIKTIEENGPLPQWLGGQAGGVGIKASGVAVTHGTFAGPESMRPVDRKAGPTSQFPNLFQPSYQGRKLINALFYFSKIYLCKLV